MTLGPIKVHDSVIRRMQRRTANYAPRHLPDEFQIVSTDDEWQGKPHFSVPENRRPKWDSISNKVKRWTLRRKRFYGWFLELALVIVVAAGYYWIWPPLEWGNDELRRSQSWPEGFPDWLMGHISDILIYALPDYFNGLNTVAIVRHPWIFWATVLGLLVLLQVRNSLHTKTHESCEEMRQLVVELVEFAV